MKKRTWWLVGGGSGAAAIGVAALVLNRKKTPSTETTAAGSGTSSTGSGSNGTSLGLTNTATTTASGNGSSSSAGSSSTSATATSTGGYTITVGWTKTKPLGVASDTATITVSPALGSGETLTGYATGTDLAGQVVIGTIGAGHSTLVYHTQGGPGSSATVWGVITKNGSVVATSAQSTATWLSSSGTAVTLPGYPSPYGTNPSAPSKSCPSGYAPDFISGYGWSCNETVAEQQKIFQSFLAGLPSTGAGITLNGVTPVSGMTQSQEVALVQAYLQKKYGGNYITITKNGVATVEPVTRAASLGQLPNPSIGASTTAGVNTESYGQATALADRYAAQYHISYQVYYSAQKGFAVIPEGETPPSQESVLYSTATGATSTGQAMANSNASDYQTGQYAVNAAQVNAQAVQGFVAVNTAFPDATAGLSGDYTGYVRVPLANGSFSYIYVHNGAYDSFNSAGQPITLHIASSQSTSAATVQGSTATNTSTTATATPTTSVSSSGSTSSGSTTSTTATTSAPTLVSTSLVYLYNENSCLYTYRKIGHYSNGTTQDLGTVTLQQGTCANKPTVKYTYRKYLYNVNSTYYTYAIMAVYTNGTQEQVGTVTVKQ